LWAALCQLGLTQLDLDKNNLLTGTINFGSSCPYLQSIWLTSTRMTLYPIVADLVSTAPSLPSLLTFDWSYVLTCTGCAASGRQAITWPPLYKASQLRVIWMSTAIMDSIPNGAGALLTQLITFWLIGSLSFPAFLLLLGASVFMCCPSAYRYECEYNSIR
jgi:hypothetical protein